MSNELGIWLSGQLKQRGWSHSELARRAKVSQAAVSSTISGDRKAGCDFCIKVAKALDESPEKILRLAEILPSVQDSEDPAFEELIELIRLLSPDQRQDVLKYTKFIYQNRRD